MGHTASDFQNSTVNGIQSTWNVEFMTSRVHTIFAADILRIDRHCYQRNCRKSRLHRLVQMGASTPPRNRNRRIHSLRHTVFFSFRSRKWSLRYQARWLPAGRHSVYSKWLYPSIRNIIPEQTWSTPETLRDDQTREHRCCPIKRLTTILVG